MRLDFSRHDDSEWLREVAQVRANYERTIDERERATRDSVPVHPDFLARTLCEVIDRDATVVIDSFTLSGWMTQWFTSRFAGQVVDAGPLAPVGHGVGMGIGVQLARPGKQVVLVIGDGGLGIGGWDIETALRYDLPLITVLWNNSSWGPSFEQMPLLKGRTDPFNMLDRIRYDQMFAVMGCHTEHVDAPQQLHAALERACKSGKAVAHQRRWRQAYRSPAPRRQPARLNAGLTHCGLNGGNAKRRSTTISISSSRGDAAVADVHLPVGERPQVSKDRADQSGLDVRLPLVQPLLLLEAVVVPQCFRNGCGE